MLTSVLINAGLVPLVAAALVTMIAHWLRAAPQVAVASGVAVAFVVAQIGIQGRVELSGAIRSMLQPADAVDWLPLVALLAWAVTLLVESGWRPACLIAGAFVITVPLRLLAGHARITREWTPLEKLYYLSFMAGIIGAIWLLLSADESHRGPTGRLLCVVAVALVAAVALTLSGSFVYGQLSAALGISAFGASSCCFLVSTHFGERSGHSVTGFSGGAGLIACLLTGLLLLGYFYAELSFTNFGLLVAALAVAAAPIPNQLAGHTAWLHIAARSVLCSAPLAVVLAGLVRESTRSYPY